jgi:hypothetical protein
MRRPKILVGTSAVALVLAASRWGTNIGISPVFLTDILIFIGLVSLTLMSMRSGRLSYGNFVPSRGPSGLFKVFYFYVLLRIVLSLPDAQLYFLVRDGAPFAYGFLAFLSASALARSTPSVRQRTMTVFWWALGAHVVWMVFVTLTDFKGISTPVGAVLEMRPDIDAAILGVGAGLYLLQAFRQKNKFWSLAAFAASIFCVLSMGSRAAFVSLAISLALAFLIHYSTTVSQKGARTVLQFALPVLLVGCVVALPFTVQGERLVATLATSTGQTTNQIDAQGTERARQLVWDGVIEWVGQSTTRTIVGGGFGNDFLAESGTLAYLEGTTYENVRSPHNWFVGIYARLGLVGLALSILVCLQLVVIILKNRKLLAQEPLLATSGLIIFAFLPVATLGVVMEAPFGAVPFWWAAGIIFSLKPTLNEVKIERSRSPIAMESSP